MVKSLINDSIAQAAQNNGYGTASNEFNSNTFYALANCWRTVDEEHCLTCLESASSTILSCMPATEGRALNAGCILKYSDQNLPRNHESIEAVKDFLLYVAYILVIITLGISTGLYIGRIAYSHRNKRQLKALKGVESDGSLFMRSLRFKSSTIEKATNHFSESQKLGQGGFGEVFKGILPDGREIAVKRLFICTASKNEDVFNEMNVISRAQHQNLVRFLGCCLTPNDSLLVYEFLANKSLDRVLFDPEKKKELDWKKRRGIIIGMAEGLQYLHNECPEKIVHRDIKASNILLDLKYRPKIADFGLAQSYETGAPQLNTAIAGTLGYMAPEYIARGQLTEKVDVFSYGIVVLEIISGERNNSFKSDESLETLVVSTWKHFQSNTISEIVDQSLEIDDPEEVTKVAQVGLLCTQEIASLRPTMKEIIQMLTQKDVQLSQPSKPPFVDETMEISHLSNSSQFSGPCNSQILQNDFR